MQRAPDGRGCGGVQEPQEAEGREREKLGGTEATQVLRGQGRELDLLSGQPPEREPTGVRMEAGRSGRRLLLVSWSSGDSGMPGQ